MGTGHLRACFIDHIEDLENHPSPVSPEWVQLSLGEHTDAYQKIVIGLFCFCVFLFLGAPESLWMVTAAMKLKDTYSLKEKL